MQSDLKRKKKNSSEEDTFSLARNSSKKLYFFQKIEKNFNLTGIPIYFSVFVLPVGFLLVLGIFPLDFSKNLTKYKICSSYRNSYRFLLGTS